MNTNEPANEQGLLPDAPPAQATEQTTGSVEAKPARPRGFATMDRDKVREIARKGGKAAHQAGTAHEFSSDEAKAAGRKGGLATHAKRSAPKPMP